MTNSFTNRRPLIKFIAYMQVICILLVVFGHSFHQYPDGQNGTSLLIYRMMYSFRMPAFIFVSGFLMAYTTFLNSSKRITITKFVKNKAKRLLIPYFVLTLITFVPRTMMNSMADDHVQLSISNFIMSLIDSRYMPIPFFWFIQASFLLLIFSFVYFYVMNRIGINKTICYISLGILFIALPYCEASNIAFFSVDYAIQLGIYFVFGMAYAQNIEKIDRVVPWQRIPFLLTCALIWAVSFFIFSDTVAYPLCRLMGVCMIISLTHIIESRGISVFDHLIGANYMIFLLSWYFNVLTQQVLSHYIAMPWYVHTVLSLTFGIYIPVIFYKYLCRHNDKRGVKILSFMLGQNTATPIHKSMYIKERSAKHG